MLAESLRSLKSTLQTAFNSQDRRAKIQDGDFITGLLYATASASEKFSLSFLRMSMCNFLDVVIGQSAFNERMGTESLLWQVKHVLGLLLQKSATDVDQQQTRALAVKLGVNSILAVDGSMVSLWDGLSEEFKGTFMTAAIKLHFSIDLVTGAVNWYELTPGATHDSQRFPELKSGRLFIVDLGYWSMALFSEIVEAGGFFLSRLKANRNLIITDVIAGGFGRSIVGQKLSKFPIHRRRAKVVELLAELTGDGLKIPVRVIGIWHCEERRYLWYITNLSAPRKAISDLYRLRWQIELSFKAMKSSFNFDRIPTLSANATQTLCLLGICHYVLSTVLRKEANSDQKSSGKLSILRAATVLRTVAFDIYGMLKMGSRITKKKINWISSLLLPLIRSYLDPNPAQRQSTVAALQTCLV